MSVLILFPGWIRANWRYSVRIVSRESLTYNIQILQRLFNHLVIASDKSLEIMILELNILVIETYEFMA